MFERYREMQERREDEGSSERGFTLIELLIVIVVLGILAAIVIFSLTGVTGQSKAAACNPNAKTVEIAAGGLPGGDRLATRPTWRRCTGAGTVPTCRPPPSNV